MCIAYVLRVYCMYIVCELRVYCVCVLHVYCVRIVCVLCVCCMCIVCSLLKVHLTLRKYRVYLDIETLKGGKFTENLLNSIRRSHNFILVLTHDALDRCVGDVDCKDWVHRVST